MFFIKRKGKKNSSFLHSSAKVQIKSARTMHVNLQRAGESMKEDAQQKAGRAVPLHNLPKETPLVTQAGTPKRNLMNKSRDGSHEICSGVKHMQC